ncbi:hypothetical protein JZ751_012011 [Albula glossodonta]|uniref:Uncharacterized protein n=1 Tax=Albula glossodonta TaxID=121402 RepID=A0A8T2PR70_9TELE|nr:hypothetical protein JZ751_012011 [Albula glossodonta]
MEKRGSDGHRVAAGSLSDSDPKGPHKPGCEQDQQAALSSGGEEAHPSSTGSTAAGSRGQSKAKTCSHPNPPTLAAAVPSPKTLPVVDPIGLLKEGADPNAAAPPKAGEPPNAGGLPNTGVWHAKGFPKMPSCHFAKCCPSGEDRGGSAPLSHFVNRTPNPFNAKTVPPLACCPKTEEVEVLPKAVRRRGRARVRVLLCGKQLSTSCHVAAANTLSPSRSCSNLFIHDFCCY